MIFTTINPDVGWDGTVKGELLPAGSYAYQLEFYSEQLGSQRVRGSIHMLY